MLIYANLCALVGPFTSMPTLSMRGMGVCCMWLRPYDLRHFPTPIFSLDMSFWLFCGRFFPSVYSMCRFSVSGEF